MEPGTQVRRKKGKYASGPIGTVVPSRYEGCGRNRHPTVLVQWPSRRVSHRISTLVPATTPTHPDIVARLADRKREGAEREARRIATPRWNMFAEFPDGRIDGTGIDYPTLAAAEAELQYFPVGYDRSYPGAESIRRVRVWIEEYTPPQV